jgi:hypothetical protein
MTYERLEAGTPPVRRQWTGYYITGGLDKPSSITYLYDFPELVNIHPPPRILSNIIPLV